VVPAAPVWDTGVIVIIGPAGAGAPTSDTTVGPNMTTFEFTIVSKTNALGHLVTL
jgi:hypothetical protein